MWIFHVVKTSTINTTSNYSLLKYTTLTILAAAKYCNGRFLIASPVSPVDMPMLPLDFFLKTNTATAESAIDLLKDPPCTVSLDNYTEPSHANAREKGQKSATYVLVRGKDLLEDEAQRRHEVYGTAVEAGIAARSGPPREPQRRQCEDNYDQAIQVTPFGRAFTSNSTQQPLNQA